MKLTLCIAVHNEEKNLHYPLDSALGIAHEVIIVDGESEDNTIKIAEGYGSKVKVIRTDNPAMFHLNKQKAIDAARGDWILQLDADEALTDELSAEIQKIIGGYKEGDAVAYWIPRRNLFLNRFLSKGGQYPDYTIRLYRRGVAHFPCRDVHENVEVKGEVGHLTSDILHYADPDFSRYLLRWDRYTTSEAALLVKKDIKPNGFIYFVIKPIHWFLKAYFRHSGYVDGFPGFVFALFSAIRFWVIYVKVWVLKYKDIKI